MKPFYKNDVEYSCNFKNMIKLIASISFVLVCVWTSPLSAQINPVAGSENDMFSKAPDFKWEMASHDFGKIEQGKPVAYTFKFTNTGNAPLVISQAKGSCECTKAEFSPAPIPPGKTGWVKAIYDASKPGAFNRNVTITANTDGGPVHIQIKGEVLPVK
jgi:hypothetical protein